MKWGRACSISDAASRFLHQQAASTLGTVVVVLISVLLGFAPLGVWVTAALEIEEDCPKQCQHLEPCPILGKTSQF